jgi:hypothetical protein
MILNTDHLSSMIHLAPLLKWQDGKNQQQHLAIIFSSEAKTKDEKTLSTS